jgi:hypothetical protein
MKIGFRLKSAVAAKKKGGPGSTALEMSLLPLAANSS